VEVGAAETKIVVFRVGQQEYAVSIGAVKEVGPWTQPVPIPEAPPLVEGVINLRGDIIPVIDLGRLFHTARLKAPEDSRTIVMEVDGQQAGFVVDDVTEVHTVADGDITPPSPVLHVPDAARAGGNLVSGIIKMGANRLVVLVDARRIMTHV
jgi:purine-binding chemotaxis protein CheW